MGDGTRRIILAVTADRGMQDALAAIIAATGCDAVIANDAEDAARRMRGRHVAFVVADPACLAEVTARFGTLAGVVELPVRVSSTGIRRIAKPRDAAIRWLQAQLEARCRRRV